MRVLGFESYKPKRPIHKYSYWRLRWYEIGLDDLTAYQSSDIMSIIVDRAELEAHHKILITVKKIKLQ
jgi:hypothetical protein